LPSFFSQESIFARDEELRLETDDAREERDLFSLYTMMLLRKEVKNSLNASVESVIICGILFHVHHKDQFQDTTVMKCQSELPTIIILNVLD
jgi:hypothetical protein